MSRSATRVALVALLLTALAATARAGEVRLANGARLRGKIIKETLTHITLRVSGKIRLDRNEITEVILAGAEGKHALEAESALLAFKDAVDLDRLAAAAALPQKRARAAAIRILSQLPGERSLAFIKANSARQPELVALLRGREDARALLLELSRAPQARVRQSAAAMLASLKKGPDIAGALKALLADKDKLTRIEAAGALANGYYFSQAGAIEARLLSDPEVAVRLALARALGKLRWIEAIPSLEKALARAENAAEARALKNEIRLARQLGRRR